MCAGVVTDARRISVAGGIPALAGFCRAGNPRFQRAWRVGICSGGDAAGVLDDGIRRVVDLDQAHPRGAETNLYQLAIIHTSLTCRFVGCDLHVRRLGLIAGWRLCKPVLRWRTPRGEQVVQLGVQPAQRRGQVGQLWTRAGLGRGPWTHPAPSPQG